MFGLISAILRILLILLIFRLYLISYESCFKLEAFVKPTKPNNPTKWKIDPVTGLKMNINTTHTQQFPVISRKLIVPGSWQENSRHTPMMTYE